jgi:hypothetical protein
LITKILKDFFSSTSFKADGEVALFRKFSESIVANSKSVFIDETHGGGVCNVSFISATGKQEICEISDLLIMTLNTNSSEVRATFWQVKKQKTSKWINVSNTGSQLDFKGQFNQWDLLSRRPKINGINKFNPPSELLESFDSPGIGSFGVFYEKGGGIELAHSTAEFISCPNPDSKHPTLTINGYLSKYHLKQDEIISRLEIRKFLESLMSFQVGALLNPTIKSHQWLVKTVISKVKPKIDQGILDKLNGFGNDVTDDYAKNDSPSQGLSILFIEFSENA